MKKSKFNLSHLHSTTLDAGKLVPVFLQETIPNDSFKIGFQSFIRAQPMLAPLMHRVPMYLQYWFVPYRILWNEWQDFITGGNDLSLAPTFPTIQAPADKGWQVGSLADYFGFPINQPGIEVSAMPFRALAEIWNTRYRDEDLQNELPISYDSGVDSTTSTALLSPSWKRDYFTTARATTQRGSSVSVPIDSSSGSVSRRYGGFLLKTTILNSTNATFSPALPTGGGGFGSADVESVSLDSLGNVTNVSFKVVVGDPVNGVFYDGVVTLKDNSLINSQPLQDSPYVTSIFAGAYQSKPGEIELTFHTPASAGSVDVAVGGSFDVRDLRLASSIQRYQENSLLWGNRYEEFIQREFGIKPRDSRIQRPEYLGGSSSLLQISEVLQTAEGTDSGVGTMRGHGVSSLGQRPIRFTAPEHGVIIGLLSIRPEPVYTQGIHREWLKRSRLDFYVPELANIGQQEVLQQEIYATKDNKDVVFGYQDRYQEYRYRAPKVTGQFRTSELSYWNMAREFKQPPVINSSFIDMASSSSAFKRPFAEQTEHSFLAMIANHCVAYRPIPKRAKNILK